MNTKTIYLHPDGRRGAKGTKGDPVSTLGEAIERIRTLRAGKADASAPVRAVLCDGIYPVTESAVMDARDSGIVWCADKGAHPLICGGVFLNRADFRPADPAFCSRLRNTPAAPILQFDLNAAHVDFWHDMKTDNGTRYAELYVGEARYDLPSYPKQNFLKFETANRKSETAFRETDPVPLSWGDVPGMRAFGYMEADYFSVDVAVTVAADGTVELRHNFSDGRSYRYYNVPQELCAKGEYYIDRERGILYVCPTDDFDTAPIMLSQFEGPILRAEGISDVRFEGLHFAGVRGEALNIAGDRVTFNACRFTRIGNSVMHLNGMENRVLFCEACAIGGAGFIISGGDCENLRNANTLVDSNHIHHFALNGSTYQAAISAEGGMGHTFSHNHIHHSIHNAINGYCPDLLVEYNLIHDVCREAHDAGAIYTGRWHSRNTVYRYNLIYNNVNINNLGVPFGIYNDDSGAGKAIYGNILCGVAGYGVMVGAGNNNQIYNNLIIKTLVSINDDERSYYGNFQESMCRFPGGFFFYEQIHFPSYATQAWNVRYADSTLLKYTNVEDWEDRWMPVAAGRTVIRGNCLVGSGPVQVSPCTAKFSVVRDNMSYDSAEAASIADVEHLDFRLLPDSPVYRDIPFWQDIPVDRIGPRKRNQA